MIVLKGKFYDGTLDKVFDYNDVHQDVLWYLLELTQVNRFVSRESLKEFLIRFLLITDQPLDQTAEQFINDGILISGTIGDQYFEYKVKDLFNFLGFSSTNCKFHVFGDLEEFKNEYKKRDYLISISSVDEKTKEISSSVMFLMFTGIRTLLEIDSLNVKFKENLNELKEAELDSVLRFVDYVMEVIPDEVFQNYKDKNGEFLEGKSLYYITQENIVFDPFEEMPRDIIAMIFEKWFGEDDLYVKMLKSAEGPDEDYMEDIKYYSKFIRFAYGVKHGLIQLNDDWYSAYQNYDPRFVDNPIEEYWGDDCEMFSTQYIYESWKMDEWIHLIP
jgi:hypothetical protein